MKVVNVERFVVWIGTSKEDNWKLLDDSKAEYVFFHLASFPSCYVILCTEENVDNAVIYECARLCANNTKYRNMKNIRVDYTPVKNVKKGECVGEVYYKSNRAVKNILI